MTTDIQCARPPSSILIEQEVDGSRSALARCTDKGAEQHVGKRIEPHVHGDDVG